MYLTKFDEPVMAFYYPYNHSVFICVGSFEGYKKFSSIQRVEQYLTHLRNRNYYVSTVNH